LGLGRMYEAYFSDTPLASKTLYDLADVQPQEDTKLQALYSIFAFNYEKDPATAERAKQMILTEFPYTSYAEFVKNPRDNTFAKSYEVEEKIYSQAVELYSAGQYVESRSMIEVALQQDPKDELVRNFAFLKAFNSGKTVGKEVMIQQLEQ